MRRLAKHRLLRTGPSIQRVHDHQLRLHLQRVRDICPAWHRFPGARANDHAPNARTLYKAIAITIPAAKSVKIPDNWPNAVHCTYYEAVVGTVRNAYYGAVVGAFDSTHHYDAIVDAFESASGEPGSCGPKWDRQALSGPVCRLSPSIGLSE